MPKELDIILSYAAKLWRRRWLVLITAILVCAIGWPVVFLLPDKYQVTAKVYLDTQTILKPLLKGLAVDSTTMEQTTLVLRKTLLSRPNLEKIIRATDMDHEAKNAEEYERILKGLAGKIWMDGGGREQIYSISCIDKDPERAKKVVEELLNLFVETALGESRFDTTSTQQFLNDQIKVYEEKLEKAETALKEFKRKNVGLMPEAGQTYFSQLASARDQYNMARLELNEAVKRRNELQQQIDDIKLPSDMPGDKTANPNYVKLTQLLQVYTDNHPEVIKLRRIIADEQKQTEQAPANEESQNQQKISLALHQNFAYQELKVSLAETKAEVAALEVRSQQYQEKMNRLQKMIDTIPQVEAELVRLNRDYGIIKDNYEEMVRRRESALITYEVEQSTDDVQFKIIEPPLVPVLPVGPKRLLFFLGTLAAGIGTGMGLVLAWIQLRPTIDSLKELKETIEFPVFGAVSMVDAAEQRTKFLALELAFWSALSVFALVFVALAGMLYLNIGFRDIIEAVRGVFLL